MFRAPKSVFSSSGTNVLLRILVHTVMGEYEILYISELLIGFQSIPLTSQSRRGRTAVSNIWCSHFTDHKEIKAKFKHGENSIHLEY